MKANSKLIILLYLIGIIIYNMSVFVVVENYNAVFWTCYSFMTVMYLISAVMTVKFSQSKVEIQFMEIPLMLVSLVFVLFEFVLSTIFMIRGNDVDIITVILTQTILLGVYFGCIITAFMRKNLVGTVESNVKENVQYIQGILVEIELMITACQDNELKKMLKKLCETVKYSDPMSNSHVVEIENKMTNCLEELKNVFVGGKTEEVKSLINTMSQLCMERNKKLILTK